ncbi:hypothetical protein F5Y04DRAFT_202104 [Hypomontagnella monticulosa]|nr:hypothetical protein F5Y04DRAFT_202104 [Hypomontagnella monticulosa]
MWSLHRRFSQTQLYETDSKAVAPAYTYENTYENTYKNTYQDDQRIRFRLRVAAFLCDFLLYTIHMLILHAYIAPRIYNLGYAPGLIIEGTYAYGGRLAYVFFSFWLVGDALGERDWYFNALISLCVPIMTLIFCYYAINPACLQ